MGSLTSKLVRLVPGGDQNTDIASGRQGADSRPAIPARAIHENHVEAAARRSANASMRSVLASVGAGDPAVKRIRLICSVGPEGLFQAGISRQDFRQARSSCQTESLGNGGSAQVGIDDGNPAPAPPRAVMGDDEELSLSIQPRPASREQQNRRISALLRANRCPKRIQQFPVAGAGRLIGSVESNQVEGRARRRRDASETQHDGAEAQRKEAPPPEASPRSGHTDACGRGRGIVARTAADASKDRFGPTSMNGISSSVECAPFGTTGSGIDCISARKVPGWRKASSILPMANLLKLIDQVQQTSDTIHRPSIFVLEKRNPWSPVDSTRITPSFSGGSGHSGQGRPSRVSGFEDCLGIDLIGAPALAAKRRAWCGDWLSNQGTPCVLRASNSRPSWLRISSGVAHRESQVMQQVIRPTLRLLTSARARSRTARAAQRRERS